MLTLLRQLWHIAGFARQDCRTNWLFGFDGGNQKERPFSSCPFFICSDGRIKSFDVCCLLSSCWFVNKNNLFTRLQTAVWKQVTFQMLIWVRVFPKLHVLQRIDSRLMETVSHWDEETTEGTLGAIFIVGPTQRPYLHYWSSHLRGKSMLEFLPPTKIEVTPKKGPFQKTI